MTDQSSYMRAFPSRVERTGERQLSGRLVPYNQIAEVADPKPGGGWDIYKEGFRSGAFSPQAGANERRIIAKIGLVHVHDESTLPGHNRAGLGYLGPFAELHEEPDGLYGNVAVLRSKASDLEDLLEAGINELSVEFRLPRANHTEVDGDGVRWRVRAHLDQVALEAKGAYTQAEVLAFRSEMDHEAADELAHQQELARVQAALDAEKTEREAEAEAAAQRRAKFQELAGRFDTDLARQKQLVKDYGIVQPRTWP